MTDKMIQRLLLGIVVVLTLGLLALSNYVWAASDRNLQRLMVLADTPVSNTARGEYQGVFTDSSKIISPQVLPRGPLGVNENVWTGPSQSRVSTTTDTDLNCRYGVAGWGSALDQMPALGVGWYLDFVAHSPSGPADVEFVQVIRVKQNKDGNGNYLSGYSVIPSLTEGGLGNLLAANPGALWTVGNEPDRGPDPGETDGGQDDTYPEVYATAYGDIYQFIKQRDPTAQVAVAGLVEVTPGRLQYLDKVWEAYKQHFGVTMPVDVWNMHLYILPEAHVNGQPNGVANVALGTDLALAIRESGGDPSQCADSDVYCWAEHDDMSVFAEQVVAMRQWMKDHGQRKKPLILSEHGILYPFEDYDDPVNPTRCYLQDEYGNCFTAARVSSYMTQVFNYLETAVDANLGYPADNYRLVQQWLWYSLQCTGPGYVSDLLEADNVTLTQVGQTFQNHVTGQSTAVNLFPDRVPPVVGTSETGAVTVTLSVAVRNNGNVQASGPFIVTFYSDASLTQPIGSEILSDLGGCARRAATAETTWANLISGPHFFWVKVDSSEVVAESAEGDNLAQGVVLVNPHQMFLPMALRDG